MIFTCTNFEGFYPTGTAAIVSAKTREDAARILQNSLDEYGLNQKIETHQMILFDDSFGEVCIMCDGDY